MVAIEEKISVCEKEFEEVRKVIIRGSDEHLDSLITIRGLLDKLSIRLENFVADLVKDVNKLSDEEVTKAMPKLFDLYSTSISLVATLKRTKLAEDLKTSSQNYYIQVDNLREFIYDTERLRLSDDDEMNQILKDINAS
jgi:hypothetical protein